MALVRISLQHAINVPCPDANDLMAVPGTRHVLTRKSTFPWR